MLHARRVTVTQQMDQHFVLLPNVMVWACDVCGEFQYDEETMKRLYLLLGMPQDSPATYRRKGSLAEDDGAPVARFQGRRGA